MVKLIIVIGLPGSGKSCYLNSLKYEKIVDHIIHDFHAGAASFCFYDSKYANELVELLKSGINCGVADISFCKAFRRNAFIEGINDNIKDIQIEYHCFENNPETCKHNVLIRNRKGVQNELLRIDEFTENFDILENYKMMPVFQMKTISTDQ